ncbi:MAG: S-layer protein [Synechococcales bacterium]|nr:S-layer protein [Synechococcales bacterium]
MKLTTAAIATLLTLFALSRPSQAELAEAPSVAQVPPTAREVLDACVTGQAEALPNPYTDVPADHWAYEAVLTMYYCGAFREATPPALIEELLNGETGGDGSGQLMPSGDEGRSPLAPSTP